MNTIRILFYSDFIGIADDPCSDFGVSELKRLILHKTRPFCGVFTVEITTIFRHAQETDLKVKVARKLTTDLLDGFDEVWVFGYRKSNNSKQSEFENELDNDEVLALERWMTKGGLLITGDHSMPDDRIGDDRLRSHQTFLNLGRALGYRIPRAGQLRVWEGPPTSVVEGVLEQRDNFNTLVGPDPAKLDDAVVLQSDKFALDLILVGAQPHRLFWWHMDKDKQIVPIKKFPDHMHVGKLKVPPFLNGEWTAARPFPAVIARARDNRPFSNERIYDLVMAYDGNQISPESAQVGRIVADASFHHYVNINLAGFERDVAGNPLPGSDLEQIAQYYANLVLWLAPRELRTIIERNLSIWLLTHPQVLESDLTDAQTLGRVGLYVAELRIGAANLFRLFFPSSFESCPTVDKALQALALVGACGALKLDRNSQEKILGLALKIFYQTLGLESVAGPNPQFVASLRSDFFESSLRQAFDAQSGWPRELVAAEPEAVSNLLRRACNTEVAPE
jgi:hypothetical protein